MEIYERIAQVRKALKMNQGNFAKSLGFAQSTVAMIEVGKRDISERHIKAICSLYHVDEHWLLTGEGKMFAETKDDYINQLVQRYNGNDILKKVISAFIELDENERQAVLKFIDNLDPDPVQKVYIAAHSSNDEPPRIATMPRSEIQAALNDEPIKSDDDLK